MTEHLPRVVPEFVLRICRSLFFPNLERLKSPDLFVAACSKKTGDIPLSVEIIRA